MGESAGAGAGFKGLGLALLVLAQQPFGLALLLLQQLVLVLGLALLQLLVLSPELRGTASLLSLEVSAAAVTVCPLHAGYPPWAITKGMPICGIPARRGGIRAIGAGACTALVSMAASTKAWIVGWLSSHETNKANTALAIQPYYLHINGYPAKSFALMAIQPCAAKLPSNLCRALPIQAIPCPHEAHPVALLWLHPSQLCTSLHHTSHRPMGPMARRASSRTGSSFVASSSSILQVAIQPCT